MGNHREAMAYFNECGIINPTRWTEVQNWICRSASMLPTWDERAVVELKEKMFEQNKSRVTMEPVDPLMAGNGNGDATEKLEASKDESPVPA
jgi:hypothetical protein